ncbi:MAG: hypothetical protein M1825_001382 [Sarcosagium campestre]|nr:MAG: hypothetical protein M1825_001382 [Sarcosagium campestre]
MARTQRKSRAQSQDDSPSAAGAQSKRRQTNVRAESLKPVRASPRLREKARRLGERKEQTEESQAPRSSLSPGSAGVVPKRRISHSSDGSSIAKRNKSPVEETASLHDIAIEPQHAVTHSSDRISFPSTKKARDIGGAELKRNYLLRFSHLEPRKESNTCPSSLDASGLSDQGRGVSPKTSVLNKVSHWIQTGTWPSEFFERGQKRIIFSQPDFHFSDFSELFRSESKSEMEDSAPDPLPVGITCRNLQYEKMLRQHLIFFRWIQEPTLDCQQLCHHLLTKQQPEPKETSPSAVSWADFAADGHPRFVAPRFCPVTEGFDYLQRDGGKWTDCIPILGRIKPSPHLSVGFGHKAFTADQHLKMAPILGEEGRVPDGESNSYFRATEDLYFPFLVQELGNRREGIYFAELKNAHSGAIMASATFQLFRWAGLEKELDHKIVAFSIANDGKHVSIYGHYIVMTPRGCEFHRYSIFEYVLHRTEWVSRWQAYQFVKNVYEVFMPAHLERIRAAVNRLPEMSFEPDPLPTSWGSDH